MRKIIGRIVVVIISSVIILLVLGIITKANKKKLAEESIKTLPAFCLMTMEGGQFCSSEIEKGPVLIVKFHPECEFCSLELAGILSSTIPKSDILVLLVSVAHRDSVILFMEQFEQSLTPGIITLIDTALTFPLIFGNSPIPTNYIYGNNLELIKIFQGEVMPETIVKLISNIEPE